MRWSTARNGESVLCPYEKHDHCSTYWKSSWPAPAALGYVEWFNVKAYRVIVVHLGAEVNFTASSLKMYNENLNTLEVFGYAHGEYNKLSGQILLDTANHLPSLWSDGIMIILTKRV